MPYLKDLARELKQRLERTLHEHLPEAWLRTLIQGRGPRAATVEVTTACNLRCPLCATHVHLRKRRFLTMELFEDILEGCGSRLRAVSLHIQGEPLVHREIFDFVRRCTDRGLYSGFSTNGVQLDSCTTEIFDSGLGFVSIAIDGCNAEDYSKYRHGGDFDRVVSATRKLMAEKRRRGATKPTVQVQAIMFPYNEDRGQELVEFLEGLETDDVRLKSPSYCASSDEIAAPRSAAAFLEEIGSDREGRHHARSQQPDGALFRNRRLCPQLERATVICDGRVVACCMDSTGPTAYGDLNEESFGTIWRGEAHRRLLDDFFRGRLDLCRYCDAG